MKFAYRSAFAVFVLLMAGIVPAKAQIVGEVDFTTTFPFYAQNTKLPAGSYRVTAAVVENAFLIESMDGHHSVFVDYLPTQSEQPHKQSDVTFHTYGDVEYMNRLWVQGQNTGMQVEPNKLERKAAASAAPVEHTILAIAIFAMKQ
jgi:hypothetical protein